VREQQHHHAAADDGYRRDQANIAPKVMPMIAQTELWRGGPPGVMCLPLVSMPASLDRPRAPRLSRIARMRLSTSAYSMPCSSA
jgi:hypothetical protein